MKIDKEKLKYAIDTIYYLYADHWTYPDCVGLEDELKYAVKILKEVLKDENHAIQHSK